jgi:hypothetical protein
MGLLQRLESGNLLLLDGGLATSCCCEPIDNDPCGLPTSWSATISNAPQYAGTRTSGLHGADPYGRYFCGNRFYPWNWLQLNTTKSVPLLAITGSLYEWRNATWRGINYESFFGPSRIDINENITNARLTIGANCPSIGPGTFAVAASLAYTAVTNIVIAEWTASVTLAAGQRLKDVASITMIRSGGNATAGGEYTHAGARYPFNAGTCATASGAAPIEYPDLVIVPIP